MSSVIRLIDTADAQARDDVLETLRDRVFHADRVLIEPTLPGVRNGGDILVNLRFTDPAARAGAVAELDRMSAHPAVRHVNGATYSGAMAPSAGGTGTVYRALLLSVEPGTEREVERRFEEDLRLLPRHVHTIVAWQLSRVEDAVGASLWTHVFEQEFTDLEGLMGPYLMHPVHWARVDRWFDPECPEMIVRERVCHSFCRNVSR